MCVSFRAPRITSRSSLYYVFRYAFFFGSEFFRQKNYHYIYILNNPPVEPGRSSEALDTSYFFDSTCVGVRVDSSRSYSTYVLRGGCILFYGV